MKSSPALAVSLFVALVLLGASVRGEALASAPDAQDPWSGFVAWAEQEFGAEGGRAARFLAEHRPERDAQIDRRILEDNLRFALRARSRFAWAKDLDEALFHNDVLPYAVLDEKRENWRPAMFERAAAIVEGCKTATEAAQALNRELFKLVNVKYGRKRERPNQSPSESMRQGVASCTGLSILLIDACRAVGVPARAAGVAKWHSKRGNHTWVEIYDQGRWWYTGAAEYDAKGLGRVWFGKDASQAVAGHPYEAVRATSWRKTGQGHWPMVWALRDTSVPGLDVTARYAAPSAAQKNVGKDANKSVCYLRYWEGDKRQVAQVRAFEAAEGKLAAGPVETRAGEADLNDMPSLELRVGKSYRLEITAGELVRVAFHEASQGKATLELRASELGLAEQSAERMLQELFDKAVQAKSAEAKKALKEKKIRAAGKEMRILEKSFGQAPESGASLWISMHGGGGAPARVNDQQWRNQIRLYQPRAGIYVAPRAPSNTWMLWHEGHIDPLFDELIATYVAARGVDPDRVYLLGYSAGGDGVYQLAPRMADRFAAAAMMAGHPNETLPDGLRNLPFMIFMGGRDKAYRRNAIAAEWKKKLADLAQKDRGGYPHKVTIYPEDGHWMGGKDKEALPWMAKHTRQPWPKKIVWIQDDVTHDRFYWLALPKGQVRARQRIDAEVTGQSIAIRSDDKLQAITLRLRDSLLDLDQPIRVSWNGKPAFTGRVLRSESAIRQSLAERLDLPSAASAVLSVRAPGQ
jgi:predicted esterase